MQFFWDGLVGAWHLLVPPDPGLVQIVVVSLQVALGAALIALVIGVPLGLVIGLGSFRFRGALHAVANAGLGLPPVVVGLFLSIALFRQGPLGGLGLIYTVPGMVLAQVLLDLPVVVALTTSAALAVEPGLVAQARALGASRWRVGALVGREARIGVIAAAIAAIGSGLSEVGAVILVGGNIDGETRTMGGAILTSVAAGQYAEGIAVGLVLLGLIFVLAASLTAIQGRRPRRVVRPGLLTT